MAFLISLSGSGGVAQASLSPRLSCGDSACRVAVSGGGFKLRLRGIELRCRSVRGGGRFESEDTGTMRIGFGGCREEMTPFKFSCFGEKPPGAVLDTNPMGVTTLSEGGTPGILMSGTQLFFACGGLSRVHVEGFFTSAISRGQCGATTRHLTLHTKLIAHGREGENQPNYDVYIDGFGGEEYDFDRPWRLRFGHEVRLRC
ncbi:MAG TPA: hypothetical protein VHP56_11885 [Solirubrobacterales bacterium]|nr:hypothetical protein [Solirubrobacterales bacterium]